MDISSAVDQLERQKRLFQADLDRIDQALTALRGLGQGRKLGRPPGSDKRTMSAAGRAAIIAAQKKRWAKVHAGKSPTAKPAKMAKARKKMSTLGRLKIRLGSLNRYGKRDEATKVQAQIDGLLAKMATK